MKTVYLSSFCVSFRDYKRLAEILHNCSNFPLGVELATSWSYPDFDASLEAQVETFRSVPVTLHAPFVEICGAEGSDELQRMESQFEKAYRWYHLFGATSMVMHTHEKKVPPSERKWMQQRAEAVILQTAERAREEGIHLTVENVGYPLQGNALFTQDEFISLFQHLPEDVGALVDTGHAMANGWDIPELIRAMGRRIHGFHLHNTDSLHDLHRPIYEPGWRYTPDEMDALLRCIRQYSPTADIILEYAPGVHICEELFRSDLRRMAAVWDGKQESQTAGKE